MSTRRRPSYAPAQLSVVLAITGLLAGACAIDPSAGPTAAPASTPPATAAPSPSGTTDATATPSPTGGPTDLPGTAFEIAPRPGAILAVVGIAHDATLALRAIPGADQPALRQLAPHEDGLRASGRARLLADTIWYEVNARGTVGWVESAFLGSLGATADDTAAIVTRLGGTPVATSVAALGQLIAESVATTEPPSRIVMTAAPSAGDLAEVTVDVLGVGDDSALGGRLHIFAAPVPGGVTLKSVETTIVCHPHRGADAEGICV